MNTVKELFQSFSEKFDRPFERGDECDKIIREMIESEKKLTVAMTDEEKQLFEKYVQNSRRCTEISEGEIFSEGFRLGVKIMIDVLCNGE